MPLRASASSAAAMSGSIAVNLKTIPSGAVKYLAASHIWKPRSSSIAITVTRICRPLCLNRMRAATLASAMEIIRHRK